MTHYTTRPIEPPPSRANTRPVQGEHGWWFTPACGCPPDVDAWDLRYPPDDMPAAAPVLVGGRWEWATKAEEARHV